MMPASFPEQNEVLNGEGTFFDLPIHRDKMSIYSFWKFSREDLEEVQKTGGVWVRVMTQALFPMKLTTTNPFRLARPLLASDTEKASICLTEDEEVVLVGIEEPRKKYLIIRPQSKWLLVIQDENDIITKIVMEFGEEVTIIGLGKDCPEFAFLMYQFGADPEKTLILDRVNKSF